MILPCLVLSVIFWSNYSRQTRSLMVEQLSEDHIRAARAKGMSSRYVFLRYALRGAMATIITIFGVDLSAVLGGAIITEVTFGLHGLGTARGTGRAAQRPAPGDGRHAHRRHAHRRSATSSSTWRTPSSTPGSGSPDARRTSHRRTARVHLEPDRRRTGAPEQSSPFLSVRDLYVHFATEDGTVKAVDGLSFDLERGSTLGIVGESGSGKSVTNLAILGLHNPRNTTIQGEILLDGQELTGATERQLNRLRGKKMAMIFQDSLAALSPFYTVGRQIAEPFMKHTGASRREARARAVDMLRKVGIPQPELRVDDYPHQFSGGMRQRAMIAMALVCDPELVIADEPTTALDVTVQAQILDLLKDLQQETGAAIIIITHDLGVIAKTADEVMVMYAGRCVERGTVRDVMHHPQHPYSWGLLSSIPAARLLRGHPARADPRRPAEPALAAARLPLPPPVRLPGPGGGRRLPHRAADVAGGRTARRRLPSDG